jgi:hypothetical protein
MWCTAGFLHAAGKMVTVEGEIVPLDPGKDAVCSFIPVEVSCDDQGRTTWKTGKGSPDRFIFRINDMARYQPAMTKALKSLLVNGF